MVSIIATIHDPSRPLMSFSHTISSSRKVQEIYDSAADDRHNFKLSGDANSSDTHYSLVQHDLKPDCRYGAMHACVRWATT